MITPRLQEIIAKVKIPKFPKILEKVLHCKKIRFQFKLKKYKNPLVQQAIELIVGGLANQTNFYYVLNSHHINKACKY